MPIGRVRGVGRVPSWRTSKVPLVGCVVAVYVNVSLSRSSTSKEPFTISVLSLVELVCSSSVGTLFGAMLMVLTVMPPWPSSASEAQGVRAARSACR